MYKNTQQKNNDVVSILETICGCKWSLRILALIEKKINRPGLLVKNLDGLSTKVLNQCLKKNQEFGIVTKIIYPESPPRVEYNITTFGEKLLHIINQINILEKESKAPEKTH